MLRITLMIWTIVASVFGLAAIVIILATPSLQSHDVQLIPWGVLIGVVLAIPVARVVTRMMLGDEGKNLK